MGFSLGVIPGLIQINAFLRAKQTVGELAKVSRTGACGLQTGRLCEATGVSPPAGQAGTGGFESLLRGLLLNWK